MTNTYPLKCVVCEEQFTVELTISEYSKGETVCPNCGSPGVVRDFSVPHNVGVVDNTDTKKGYFNSKQGYHR